MFQVRATVIDFLGDIKTYPCHMNHKIGDEVVFDGGKYTGSLCPDMWPLIAPKVAILHQAGPRALDWICYYPFWHCSVSVSDPGMKKYDGLGFRNVLKTIEAPKYSMASLINPNAFKWPPHNVRNFMKDFTQLCPDQRSSMLMKLEAFDISEGGYDVPYFRRQMAILAKLSAREEVAAKKLIKTFTRPQIEGIYPPLSPILLEILADELDLMGYIKNKDGVMAITPKGKKKLKAFKAGLTDEEREAFEEY
jgi:uncharacterized repeat protein (TIGR04076 family)